MLDVVIALVPALVAAVVFFGLRALTLVLVSVLSCVLFETLFNKIRKRKNTVFDLSCVVTGILFAFNLPIVAPYWLAVFGAFFAIVVAKMLFGGLGKNFINPALSARAACLTSWPGLMSTWVAFPAAKTVSAFSEPLFSASKTFDGVTGATPLSSLKAGTLPTETFADLFFGFKGGCIGEICCAALLLGGIYLLVRRVITWHIPVAYIGTVALLTFLFHMKGGQAVFFDFDFMLAEILSGVSRNKRRTPYFRHRLRRSYRGAPLLRRNERGRKLFDFDNECLCLCSRPRCQASQIRKKGGCRK